MRLYQSTQASQKVGVHDRKENAGLRSFITDRHLCQLIPPCQVTDRHPHAADDDLIKPRKPPNPVLASRLHRALHQELTFRYRRGELPRRKPELQVVLENKRREQRRRSELALQPPTDLEVKLRSRRRRLQRCELEEEERSRNLEGIPEFVHVRQTLRHVHNSFQ